MELRDAHAARSAEHPWGLVDIGEDGEPTGVECWEASTRLPADFLAALPHASKSIEAGAA